MDKQDERARRLAEALRQNLHRRKAQERQTPEPTAPDSGGKPGDPA